MIENLKKLESAGLSASIYTQPFDIEGEENGLLTYEVYDGKMGSFSRSI